MNGPQLIERQWFIDVAPQEARIRCCYRRRGEQVERFTVQLQILLSGDWCICQSVMFDPDANREQTLFSVDDVNEAFTFVIEGIRRDWKAHQARFVGKIKS